LPSCAIQLTPPSPATPARTTRVLTGVPARGRQAVFRLRRHLVFCERDVLTFGGVSRTLRLWL
jgi:hypothetical protein